MQIPLGRIIFTDLGINKWGRTLYLVIKPTLECTNCGYHINNWKKEQDGFIYCPNCNSVTEQNYVRCKCGQYDLIRLRVIQNNNWGVDNEGVVTELNDKIGHGISQCKKELQKQIKQGGLKLLSAKQSVDKKRLIAWTSSDDYQPGKPIPDEIIEYWRYEDQE